MNRRLPELLAGPGARPEAVHQAMHYALTGPGKRIRPVLTLVVADLFGVRSAPVLDLACSVEMVHACSLILDDLPSMDDASTRRGRPACHVAHGEANAVLAAFALLSRAYEILAEGWAGAPAAATRAAIARDLGRAVGMDGMVAGQARDLSMAGRTLDFATLEFIHSRKTGALFTASAALGAATAGASAAETSSVVAYAKNLGLAFQVVDDLIDATGRAEEAGKDVGKDVKKTTFVSFSGVEGARQLAEELSAASREALAGFGPRAQALRDLARYVVLRKK